MLCNTECGRVLHNAGKHSKLGELIGKAVTEATLSSMEKNGVTPDSQGDTFKRLERFGITKGSLQKHLAANGLESAYELDAVLKKTSEDKTLSAFASSIIHIADEISWGLMPPGEGYEAGRRIICAMYLDVPETGDLISDFASAFFASFRKMLRRAQPN